MSVIQPNSPIFVHEDGKYYVKMYGQKREISQEESLGITQSRLDALFPYEPPICVSSTDEIPCVKFRGEEHNIDPEWLITMMDKNSREGVPRRYGTLAEEIEIVECICPSNEDKCNWIMRRSFNEAKVVLPNRCDWRLATINPELYDYRKQFLPPFSTATPPWDTPVCRALSTENKVEPTASPVGTISPLEDKRLQ
jgi:hypothetical protein